MTGKKLVLAAIALALVQIGFLSWIVAGRAAVLRDGREVLLKVEPVDPRDLLRGDYVVLNYEISAVPVSIVSNAPVGEFTSQDGPIFVRLGKDEDGYWRARSATLGAPAGIPAEGEVDIRGEVRPGWSSGPDGTYNVSYGINRYYVPEGEGSEIETNMRDRPFSILAAVGPDGQAQIKALMDGETRLYAEPLY
ncbi:MAG: GDYXXLXY domain-containing protein [Rhizobiaceae bacterium]|nr:GDYXXLXY domain-containing protein [Rhizobiaceae bacterium]